MQEGVLPMKSNIILIVMDSMRLDEFKKLEDKYGMVSSLGNPVFMDGCIAPAPWTLPSHASLFTGLYPSSHGAHETTNIKSLDIDRIKLKIPTLVSELNSMGFHTYGISANPYVHPVYGFSEFSSFEEEPYFTDIFGSVVEVSQKLKPIIAKYRNIYGNNMLRISKSILNEEPALLLEAIASASVHTPAAVLKKIKAKVFDGWPIEKGGSHILGKIKNIKFEAPYFLFINLMEAHDPYTTKSGADFNWATPFLKEGPNKSTISTWKRLYTKASFRAYKYATQIAGTMLERYGNDQLIIFTSDHGQAFNEHGFIGHGTMLYDEIVKIPFATVSGRDLGKRGKGFCSLVNVRRFMLDYLNGGKNPLLRLYSKAVYSQSFGIPANIRIRPEIDIGKVKKLDVKRVRRFVQ